MGNTPDSANFTCSIMKVPVADGVINYTVATTVNDEHISHRLTVTAPSRVPLTPQLTWPTPKLARLALVDPDGAEVAFSSTLLEPAADPPEEVVVPSGVWTEVLDAGIEVFHETVSAATLSVHDGGEVTGFDKLYRLRVRTAPPSRDYDDTYED